PVRPQISTPSLHDALPISLVEPSHAQGYDQILQRIGHAWQQMKQGKNYLGFLVTSTTQKAAVLACLLLSIYLGEMGSACLPNARDRKSTRLNSSHQIISYA